MSDRDDRILDACLEEALGGQTPPDLTDRILHALATRPGGAAPASLPGDTPRTGHPAPVILREGVPPVHSSTLARASSKRPAWLAAAVAASLLAVLVGYGLMRQRSSPGLRTMSLSSRWRSRLLRSTASLRRLRCRNRQCRPSAEMNRQLHRQRPSHNRHPQSRSRRRSRRSSKHLS